MTYYNILGIEKNATHEEIKQAYKKLAVEIHPDKKFEKNNKESIEKFKELNMAYTVLKNPQERAAYDMSINNSLLYNTLKFLFKKR